MMFGLGLFRGWNGGRLTNHWSARLITVGLGLTALTSFGCATVPLTKFPEPSAFTPGPSSTGIDLYLGTVNMRADRPISQADRQRFRYVLGTKIASAHYFKSVQDLAAKPASRSDGYVVMHAEVTPREDGGFALSAVQNRRGIVSVTIDAMFFDPSGSRILEVRGEKANPYEIVANGFSRTDPAEERLRDAYAEALSMLVNKMTGEGGVAAILNGRGEAPVATTAPASQPVVDVPSAAAPTQESDVDDPPKIVQKGNEKSYAIVVGVEQYRQGLPRADFATRDAQTVANYLVKSLGYPEENVVRLLNDRALKSDFEKYFEKWLGNQVEPDSSVFIYFSGHGAPEPKTGNAYLVPYDGDPMFIDQTGYSLARLYESLGKLRSKQVVVVLDSCFSGGGGRSVLARGARPIVAVQTTATVPAKLTVLSASAADQTSSAYDDKKHGLFTFFLLKAIKDQGMVNRDGSLKTAELMQSVRPQVERVARKLYNSEQTPQIIQAKR